MKAIHIICSMLCFILLFGYSRKTEIIRFTDPSAISVRDRCFLIVNPPKNASRLLHLVFEHYESCIPNDTVHYHEYYKETWFTRRNHKVPDGKNFYIDYLAYRKDLLACVGVDPRGNKYSASAYSRGNQMTAISKVWIKECPLANEPSLPLTVTTFSDNDSISTGSIESDYIMTDYRDRQKYRIVKIGTLVWMGENLNYQTANSWCYDSSESNCKKFGRLYDWNTAKKVCPNGWHLPSREEWNNLVATVGNDVAGKTLMSRHSWRPLSKTHRGMGTDSYGWSALPSGHYNFFDNTFEDIGTDGYWWTSTTNDDGFAYSRDIHYGTKPVRERDYCHMCNGFSVRCVQDITTNKRKMKK